jgi:hypothetical protein
VKIDFSNPIISWLNMRTEQLDEGMERIRAALGAEPESGLSDETISQALWSSWFNVDQATEWLIGVFKSLLQGSGVLTGPKAEQERRTAAKERKGKAFIRCVLYLRLFLRSRPFIVEFKIHLPMYRMRNDHPTHAGEGKRTCLLLSILCLSPSGLLLTS